MFWNDHICQLPCQLHYAVIDRAFTIWFESIRFTKRIYSVSQKNQNVNLTVLVVGVCMPNHRSTDYHSWHYSHDQAILLLLWTVCLSVINMTTSIVNCYNSCHLLTYDTKTTSLVVNWAGYSLKFHLTLWCPLLPYGYTTGIKHPVPDRVKLSFVIFDIWALWRSWLGVRVPASECPDVKNYKWRLNPVWHRMLYSCAHMATAGIKGKNMKIINH